MLAFDKGNPPRNSSLDVKIRVLDANDNLPIFHRDLNEVEILENNRAKNEIFRASAIDSDEGINGEVVYFLSPQTVKEYGDLFEINKITGSIFVKQRLDREKQEKYLLNIVASDSPMEGKLTSQMSLVVKLIDLNDNAPNIKLSLKKIPRKLSLLSKPETFVAHFTASDPDYKDNGEFWCWLGTNYTVMPDIEEVTLEKIEEKNFTTDPNFSLLRMHPTEFKIVTSRKFSISDDITITFAVTCHDEGDTSKISQKKFDVVFILPESEMETSFKKKNYLVIVEENNEVGKPLIQLEIVNRPRLNSREEQINGAKRKKYIADRAVTDLSGYKFSVTKKDRYKSPIVSVNGSGWLIAEISFDREDTPLYNLEIVALHKSSSTYQNFPLEVSVRKNVVKYKSEKRIFKTNLKIEVKDVDDEKPFFLKSEYHFGVSGRSAMTVGSIVGVVKAVDKDSSEFSSITYSLLFYPASNLVVNSQASSKNLLSTEPSIDKSIYLPFQINRKTGLISLNRRLDYESLLRQSESPYVFNAVATSTFHKGFVNDKVKVYVEFGDTDNHNDVILIDFNSISLAASKITKQTPIVYLKEDSKVNDEIVAWTQNFNREECCIRYRLKQEIAEGQSSLDQLTTAQKDQLFIIDVLTGSIKLNFDVSSLISSLYVKLTIAIFNDTSLSNSFEQSYSQQHLVEIDSGNIRIVYQKYASTALHSKQVYKILSSEKLAVILSVTLVAIFTSILALLVIICLAKLKKMRIYNYNQNRLNAKFDLAEVKLASTNVNANAIADLNSDKNTLSNKNNNYYATYNAEQNTISNNFLKSSIIDDCLLNELGGRVPCEGHEDTTNREESISSLNGLLITRCADKKEVGFYLCFRP